MESLPQTATANAMPARQGNGSSLGPSHFATALAIEVYNASIDLQLIYPDDAAKGIAGGWHYGPTFQFPPAGQIFPGCYGFRSASHTPGVPAAVLAQLWEAADGPPPSVPVPITATITASGGLNPGLASVQIAHNGAIIATEPTVDFEDLVAAGNVPSIIFTVLDDQPNTRGKVGLAAMFSRNAAALLSFPGGSRLATTLANIAHGLPSAPAVVVATMTATNTGSICVPQVTGITATKFDLSCETSDGSSPPNTGQATFAWLAIL